jgi:hypothetical protein
MTWLVVAFNALLVVAMLGGAPLGASVWFLGNLVLGVLWVASHPRRRTCPQCATEVPRAFLVCTACRYDFHRALPPRLPRTTGQS